jgi:hypothetical protein
VLTGTAPAADEHGRLWLAPYQAWWLVER